MQKNLHRRNSIWTRLVYAVSKYLCVDGTVTNCLSDHRWHSCSRAFCAQQDVRDCGACQEALLGPLVSIGRARRARAAVPWPGSPTQAGHRQRFVQHLLWRAVGHARSALACHLHWPLFLGRRRLISYLFCFTKKFLTYTVESLLKINILQTMGKMAHKFFVCTIQQV